MKESYIGDITNKNSPALVDFNYPLQKGKNPIKNMFQIFTPKSDSNNNPKDIFKANNHINSILTKNLNSIYQENKNDISKDNPLYENVNCLIQKNNDNNKYIYNKMLNNNNEPKRNNLFLTSIKNNIDLRKQLGNIETNNPIFSFNLHKGEIKTPKNFGKIKLFSNFRRSSKSQNSDNKSNSKITFTKEALINQPNNELKYFKDKLITNKKDNSNTIVAKSKNINNIQNKSNKK